MQFFNILNINFKQIFFITFFIIVFYGIFIKLRSKFCLLRIIYWKLLQHCLPIEIIYTPILSIWRSFIFITIYHVFVIWHILPFILFSTINSILISVKRFSFILVFFKATCHANPATEIYFAGSRSYSLRHIFLKFSNTSSNYNISLCTYKSWYFPNFLFQNIYKLFLHARNLHQ